MRKVIISVAVTGSSPTKDMNPAIPYSPEEIAKSALESWHAGASIAHIHVRDPLTGKPSSRLDLFEEVQKRIRSESDMIVNLTTSGLNLKGSEEEIIEKRLEPLSLKPDICSLDIGSMNFGDRVFTNSPQWVETAAQKMKQYGIKPELEVFEAGHLSQAINLIDKGLIVEPAWFQLCMGIRWGIEATAENLLFLKNKLPTGSNWSVLGVGSRQLPMIAQSILLGGHVRVGFEDNIYLRKGVLAASNAKFVEQTVSLIHQLQYEVATTKDARDLLGISWDTAI